MKHIYQTAALLLALSAPLTAGAQSLKFDGGDGKATYIMPARDTITVGYANDMVMLPVVSNTDYTAATSNDWITLRKEANGNVSIWANYYYDATKTRTGTVTLTSSDSSYTRKVIVQQTANNSATTLSSISDTKLTVKSGSASQSQSGEGIERSYDGNTSTLYHSPYYSTTFPVTLTYNLSNNPHVDYVLYTPRQDGNTNGNFGQVKIEYQTSDNSGTWVTLTEIDLDGSSAASRIDFGSDGVDNVTQVRFTVSSGSANLVSCAEMGFYQKDETLNNIFKTYFKDNICSELKDGITEADVPSIPNAYARQLVYNMLNGYDTNYRVGEFEAYRSLSSLANELKTNSYNAYENPTGIYFTKGQTLVLFVEGIETGMPVSLTIKSFGPNQGSEDHPESSYSLANGVNVITAANRGNGYISYYTTKYETAPKVKIHFALADVNGYFDLERGDDNTYWKKLLLNAKSDILDIRTKRMQVAAPVSTLKSVCASKGVELATIYDNVIYREREIMGLEKYGREPKNRQFARPVDSGMFADGIGAAASFGSFSEWANPNDFGFWGFGHELGHVNQVRPGLKWVGCGETTNNIYSAWVEHTLGSGYHRLEDETSGIDEYSGLRGGRFEAYLEEGVRKGVSWQLQDGPDYHGATPESSSVAGEDYNGNKTATVTTTSRNYDHFVKVVPFWQLELYCLTAGKAPDAFGKVIEGIRTYANESSMSNGQLQIKFMRSFCDSTQTNFLDFFEKAGMLRPIDAYIEDYSKGWLKINETMINELKEYIAAKNYPEPAAALNYINAYNWETFRDEGKLAEGTVGSGCTKLSSGRIQVDNTAWKNAVGYETYDADGNLLRITMFGLGATQQTSRYTQVLWPSTAAYIMAVGYDGTRVKIYEP